MNHPSKPPTLIKEMKTINLPYRCKRFQSYKWTEKLTNLSRSNKALFTSALWFLFQMEATPLCWAHCTPPIDRHYLSHEMDH